MNVRVDPRRLRLLKELAADAGVRPGELVQRWVEERIDAERSGTPASGEILDTLNATLASMASRLDALAARVGVLERASAAGREQPARSEGPGGETTAEPAPAPAAASADAEAPAPAARPRRRGRQQRSSGSTPATDASPAAGGARVALHDEIIEVIRERGPMRAGELASAISERGRYVAPRSSKPLDATTVNSRVSNPVYRDRFVRREGKIGLAGE
jgi:HK97 family phage major capsid protein